MFSHSLDTYTELRLLEERYAGELFALTDRNRARLREWLPWVDGVRAVEDTRTFCRTSLERFADNRGLDAGIWVGGKLAGVIALWRSAPDGPIGELGFWLGADHEGQGFVTRAARSVLTHGFMTLGIDRIALRTALDNERGQRVAERLGFAREGVAQHGAWLNGVPRDLVVYGLLAKQWRG